MDYVIAGLLLGSVVATLLFSEWQGRRRVAEIERVFTEIFQPVHAKLDCLYHILQSPNAATSNVESIQFAIASLRAELLKDPNKYDPANPPKTTIGGVEPGALVRIEQKVVSLTEMVEWIKEQQDTLINEVQTAIGTKPAPRKGKKARRG